MMNRTEMLELIRQKCIEANPEILGRIETRTGGIMIIEPVRLADVLLAIVEESKARGLLSEEDGGATQNTQLNSQIWRDRRWTEAVYAWNLRADDLTQQSDECITFLYELLK